MSQVITPGFAWEWEQCLKSLRKYAGPTARENSAFMKHGAEELNQPHLYLIGLFAEGDVISESREASSSSEAVCSEAEDDQQSLQLLGSFP